MGGARHVRLGPVMVGPGGLLQPVTDVLKLFTKRATTLSSSNHAVYIIRPGLAVGVVGLLLRFTPWVRWGVGLVVFVFGLLGVRALGQARGCSSNGPNYLLRDLDGLFPYPHFQRAA